MKRILPYLTLFLSATSAYSYFDNRYLPLFDYTYQHQVNRRSVLASNVFIIAANQGYVELKGGHIPLPEIFGKYDLMAVANALVRVGKPNPLPTSWQAPTSLIFDMEGKMQATGFWLGWEQYLGKNLSIGVKAPFMHVNSQLEFTQSAELAATLGLGAGGSAYLYQVLNQANQELGFNSYQWQKTDLGDLDVYLRWGKVQDYVSKFKHVDASLKLGALFPISSPYPVDTPVAIPFGYYNHYGLYLEIDVNCELKDDLKVGFWLNGTGRFGKKQLRRMAAGAELPQFGAIIGQAFVDPGISIGFSPYVFMDDLHNGLGVRGSYRLLWHGTDYWQDARENYDQVAAQLSSVIKDSGWLAEYFTVGLVYDVQQQVGYDVAAPFFYLDLDIPTGIMGAELVSKAYRLTLGFEFNF